MKRSSAAAANKRRHKQWPYHLMMLPGMIFLIIFHLVPMGGLLMAFQDFMPIKGLFGSRFVGLKNFERLFKLPTFWRVLRNTVVISVGKLVLVMVASVIFALLLNECRHVKYKRIIQTTVYLPHFLSWVILAVMFSNVFSYTGIVSQIAQMFGGEPTMFMISNSWFRKILIGGEIWKEFGYGAIVYVAAITGIDPTLYEAAGIDGAGRWKKMWYITLPSIIPTIVLMTTLNIGKLLKGGFDQVFNLYSPLVYETGDIIDTYVYRMGLVDLQYSNGTAVGLFQSLIGFILLVIAYKLADKLVGYRAF
ncbi:MAG: sugar ABC transporter permease [Lachnospiraceae bacterium]|nr:sugar ABC transporter permease [Lachnospiraceae bacterium]